MLVVVKERPTNIEISGTSDEIRRVREFVEQESSEPIPASQILADIENYLGLPRWAVTLKAARLMAKLTQKELAARLNVTRQYITNLENGRGTIGKTKAKALAKVLTIPNHLLLLDDTDGQ